MRDRMKWLSAAVVLAGMWAFGAGAAGEYSHANTETPDKGRVAALVTSLFYHDPALLDESAAFSGKNILDGTSFASTNPRQTLNSSERGKVVEFGASLVYEGGFFPAEIYQMMGYKDIKTARIANLSTQLDRAAGKRPDPWEVAGRIGRSGMAGSSDHWAMAPGDDGDDSLSSPGTLAYLPMLAVVYANYPEDGGEAAAQLAILKDDDLRAAPAARAAFSLLTQVLTSEKHDKDAWLRTAAADSLDADTEHDVRMARIKEWRYLRGEECAMGRIERAIYLWYKGNSYDAIMAEGRKMLRSREALSYLACLSGVTYGLESLPDRVIVKGSSDQQLLGLITDLHDLATSEAVLRVGKEVDY